MNNFIDMLTDYMDTYKSTGRCMDKLKMDIYLRKAEY